MVKLEEELNGIQLSKEQISLLKSRVLNESFDNQDNQPRDSDYIRQLFNGADVKDEVIIKEAKQIYEEDNRKKKNKGRGLYIAIVFGLVATGISFMAKYEMKIKERINVYSQAVLKYADYNHDGFTQREEEVGFNINLLTGKDVDIKLNMIEYLNLKSDHPILKHSDGKKISDDEIIEWINDYSSQSE